MEAGGNLQPSSCVLDIGGAVALWNQDVGTWRHMELKFTSMQFANEAPPGPVSLQGEIRAGQSRHLGPGPPGYQPVAVTVANGEAYSESNDGQCRHHDDDT